MHRLAATRLHASSRYGIIPATLRRSALSPPTPAGQVQPTAQSLHSTSRISTLAVFGKPQQAPSVGDYCVRMWTIVSSGAHPQQFQLTMCKSRHAYRHAVRDLEQTRCPQSSLLESTRVQSVEHTAVGVTGGFTIQPAGEVKMLCVAGVVGMSPFFSAKGGCNAGYLVPVHRPTVTLQLLSTVAPPGVRI